MRLLTFKNGIHMPDHKEATNQAPIKTLPPCETYVFPLGQNGGAPCDALVKKGDRVLRGQKIGDSEAFVSAPIHSSVAGEVTAIEPRLTNKGVQTCIVIKNDFSDEAVPALQEPARKTLPSPEETVKLIREAGLIGLGGAGFPTHVKLSPPPGKVITDVIVNGAECEPYLTSDHRIMLEEPELVIKGLEIVMHIFDLKTGGHIAIEENKPDAIETMKKSATPEMAVHSLKKKYPQGSEKHLVYAVTKREIPTGGLPADVGCVIINVDTAAAIAKAVLYHTPVMERIITVAGTAVADPVNLRTRVGTPLEKVIEAAGGFTCEPEKILLGGPMMGVSIPTTDLPVTKTTSALIAYAQETHFPTSHCVRCGRCAAGCPMHLLPMELQKRVENDDWEACRDYSIMSCIECGCCTYVCPAGLRIVESIRRAKAELRKQGGKK